MSLDELQAMALGVMFASMSISITLQRPAPDDAPIETSGIWQQPLDETFPIGTDRSRLDARKVMAVAKSATLSSLPRGTTIQAPELDGGPVLTWRVDGYDRPVESDLMRVVLVLVRTADL